MARISHVLILTLNGLLLACADPQYGPGGGGSNQGGGSYNQGSSQSNPPPPQPPQQQSYGGQGGNNGGGQSNYGGQGGNQGGQSNYGGQGGNQGGQSSGGSSSGGGDLSVQCKATPDGSGKIRYDCSGVNKDAITLKTEHFLWLENQASSSQNLDIEIPNYNIDEFIKAAYKSLGPQEGAKINILLKKPQLTYNAEKAEGSRAAQNAPAVSVNYQPVDKVSVHYPTQKAYSNGGGSNSGSAGPAPAPQAGGSSSGGSYSQGSQGGSSSGGSYPQGGQSGSSGGAYSRPQRESNTRYYFIRQ